MNFNLASERVRRGLNQTKLAKELGVSLSTISAYEKNIRDMPADFLNRAADFFGCTTDYLLDRTDERTDKSAS